MAIASCCPDGKRRPVRAIALYSGSPESSLAVRLAERAGLSDILLIYFRTPFFPGEDEVGLLAKRDLPNYPFRSVTLKRDFLRIALVGNTFPFPCGACRHVLLRRAARLARRLHVEVIVTGEVVGKGGLSTEVLAELDQSLGLSGRVLRPLSAKVLPPTMVEHAGAVDRSPLLGLVWNGAAREELQHVARDLGLAASASPRECLLSDEAFLGRFRQALAWERATANTIQLARFVHCYKIEPEAKVVIAFTKEEQKRLHTLFLPTDVRLYIPTPGSPLALVRAQWTQRAPEERAAILQGAAQKLLEVAGLPTHRPWSICYRCEGEEETQRMVVPCPQPSSLIPG